MGKKARIQAIPIKPPRVAHMKPEKFKHYLTLGELAMEVEKDRDWIRKLEREGRIPTGVRSQFGALKIRLYSPETVKEIKAIFANMRSGRPRKGGQT